MPSVAAARDILLRRRVLAVFILACFFVPSLLFTEGLSASEADQTVPRRGGEYIRGSSATVTDECQVSIAAREGGWVCPDQTGLTAPRPAGTTTSAPAQGYCRLQGCWDKIDSTHAEYTGTVAYGFGSTPLGTVDSFFKVTMNGAQSVSFRVRFESTRGVRDLVVEGERLYISSAHPEGNGVNDGASYAWVTLGATPANTVANWPSPGYKSYENTTAHASIVHNWVWFDRTYPGRWFCYAKSIILDRQASGAYYFTADSNVPSSPAECGWVVT